MKIAKLLAIVFVTVLMFSNISFGQNAIPSGTARFEALGFSPFFMDASRDMNNNPAWASQYRNYTFGDIGRDNNVGMTDFELTNQFAGINFGISKDMTLGLILNNRDDMWNEFIGDPTFTAAVMNQPIVPLKILFSWSTKTLSLGLAPYYTAWSNDHQNTPTVGTLAQDKRNSSSMGGTIGILSISKTGWIEGAIEFKMNSFKLVNTAANVITTTDNAGGTQISVMTRGFFQVDKKTDFNIVPFLNFGMYSWNPQVVPAPVGQVLPKYSMMRFGGGVGINFRILEEGLLATGLSVQYMSRKTEQLNNTASDKRTFTEFILPRFNIGTEWNLTDWMQARLGYSRAVISNNIKNEFTGALGGIEEWSQADASNAEQTITMGLGFQFGRFSFDGSIGENFFKQGPNVISGNNARTFFGILSASYNFNR